MSAPVIKHRFTSQIADANTNGIIKPSNWNDNHDILMDTGKLLGRASSFSGAAEEVTPDSDDFRMFVDGSTPTLGLKEVLQDPAGEYLFPRITVDEKGRVIAIENGGPTGANASAIKDYLVGTADLASLPNARTPQNTSTIHWNVSVANEFSADWQGLETDLTPSLGGNLDLDGWDITGTGNINTDGDLDITGSATIDGDVTVADLAYDATTWNGSAKVPTRNAVRDKIEAILAGPTFTGAIIISASNPYIQLTDTDTNADCFVGANTSTGSAQYFADYNGEAANSRHEWYVDDSTTLRMSLTSSRLTMVGNVAVTDDAYAAGWNGSADVPTKNAVYDKIETLQPLDSDLTTFAALTPSNDDIVQRKAGAWTNRTIAQLLTDLAAPGTTFQPLDSDLTAFAALSPSNDDIVQRKAGAWTNRTIAQLLTDLAAPGTTFQPLDPDLTSIAALTTTAAGRSILTYTDPNTNAIIYWDDSDGAMKSLTLGSSLEFSGDTFQRAALTGAVTASAGSNATASTFDIVWVINGNGSTISTGVVKGSDYHADFAFTIQGWTVLAGGSETGAIVIDAWKDSYSNFPPTVADTIAGSEKPTITATGAKGQDTSLSTWTTSVSAGDVIRLNVDSVTSLTAVTVILKCSKTS